MQVFTSPTLEAVHPRGVVVLSPMQPFSAAPALLDLTLSHMMFLYTVCHDPWPAAHVRLLFAPTNRLERLRAANSLSTPSSQLALSLTLYPVYVHRIHQPPPLLLHSARRCAPCTFLVEIATLLVCAPPDPRLTHITLDMQMEAGVAQWTPVDAGPLHGSTKSLKIRGMRVPLPVLRDDWAAMMREGFPSRTGTYTFQQVEVFIPTLNGDEAWCLTSRCGPLVVSELECCRKNPKLNITDHIPL
ncbi:hypothetical protein B0H10DRAFT_2219534 [Mycena sp. CBHHK59/15]|nr:hypothetical protein B0H10DRAFT_2219534 [Mycena sp. CBHHK59/15]